ncbi:fatty acid-binding protein, adipocyte-like [Pomacea canaliculata]|uniref:fatty acid-binding protein, adipocyte-like n=1 Tax=Pomacea canaliculata TaxID=400727 RepID=UPI000D72E79D|nr:fatty acid-binding protein, adipocyte-like [Pomacea canaliculata]
MADNLIGTWESVSAENVDAFLDAVGASDSKQFARDNKPILTVARVDGGWKLTTKIGDRTRDVIFPIGKEVDTVSLMGHTVKSVLTEEGGRLVEIQKWDIGDVKVVRSLENDNLVTQTSIKDAVATIRFKRA